MSKNKVTNLLEGKFGENALVLYLVVFLAVNFAGMSLFSDSVWAPYLETSSTDAPDGSAWIDGQSLLWAYGGEENRIQMLSGDDRTGGGTSVSGPFGSVWVSGERAYYIDENQDRRWVQGRLVERDVGSAGSMWIDSRTGLLHYIDENQNHRMMLERHTLRFDGSSDLVDVGTVPLQDPPGSFTVEGWMYMRDTPSDSWASVFSTRNGGDGDGFWIFVDDGSFPLDISYSLDFKDTGRVHSSLQFSDEIERETWHHVALVWDQSDVYAYLDGDLLGTYDASGEEAEVAEDLAIGYDKNNGYPLEGDIEDVRIWDRALTQSEIQSSMERKVIGDEDDLVGAWPFDEGEGETAFDLTSNDNHGDISGPEWSRSDR